MKELIKMCLHATEEDLLKYLQIYRAANEQQAKADETRALLSEIVKKYDK